MYKNTCFEYNLPASVGGYKEKGNILLIRNIKLDKNSKKGYNQTAVIAVIKKEVIK